MSTEMMQQLPASKQQSKGTLTVMLFEIATPIIMEEIKQLPTVECIANPSIVNGVVENIDVGN